MTRFINFNGQTQYRPGGITKLTSNAGFSVSSANPNIIHLLGEADGGAPGSEGVITIDDPALAKQFRSGPLADAIRVAFGASGDDRVPGGAYRVIAYKTNNSTQSNIQLPGDTSLVSDTAAAASTTTLINLTTGGLIVDAHIDRWVLVSGEKRRITENTATSLTVSPALSKIPAVDTPVSILNSHIVLTSEDWGEHTKQVSVELEAGTGETFIVTLAFEDQVERSEGIGGDPFIYLKYSGGAQTVSGTVDTSGDTTGVTFQLDVLAPPLVDAWAAQIIRFSNGIQRLISANTAADPSVVTLAAGHALSADEQAAVNGTTAEVINVLTANASIQGANGKATNITSVVTPSDDPLAITFTEGMTLRELVTTINATTNYTAAVPDGVNQDTVLAETFDFGTRSTTVDVRFDEAITPETKGTFRQDLQVLVDWINNFSELVTAKRATGATTEGSELPDYTGGVSGTVRDVPVYLVGGSRGTSTNSAFQNGFDALIETRGNHIIPLISQDLANEGLGSTAEFASVAAQLLEHVKLARTTYKNEQGGYLGFNGSLTNLVKQVKLLNDTDIQFFVQKMSFLNINSKITLMDEWATAVAAASMRSGVTNIGDPLTYKFIATSALDQHSSWKPSNLTDTNTLIQNGVMFAEITDRGIRWVRDLTSHTKSDDITYIDGNTRDAVRYVAYDFRTHLENRFTGEAARPASIASVREEAAAKLAKYVTAGVLVPSLDPETESVTLPGFRRLRVFNKGNVMQVSVEIFPVTGIVFQLNDIYLQVPILAA